MNYTQSGIIAQGAPNSTVRILSEIEHAKGNHEALLMLTEEGRDVVDRFLRRCGCVPENMPVEDKVPFIMSRRSDLGFFLTGVEYMGTKII